MFDICSACKKFNKDKDLKVLSKALYLSRKVLRVDAKQLGSQLSGRLRDLVKNDKPLARLDPRSYPYIKYIYS